MPAQRESGTDEPGYEAARTELADIVRTLESGGLSLEESLALWQRGEDLATVCQRWLESAGRRLDDAIASADARATENAKPGLETSGSPSSKRSAG